MEGESDKVREGREKGKLIVTILGTVSKKALSLVGSSSQYP